MLVQIGNKVSLALELPLKLLRMHVVGVSLLVCWVEVVHALVRCRFKMIVGQRSLIKKSATPVSGSIRAVGLDSFHIGRKSAA